MAPLLLRVMDQVVSADSIVVAMPGAVPSAARSPKVQDEGDGAAAMSNLLGLGLKNIALLLPGFVKPWPPCR
jgi:hypothetical protein